jgi:hypothetical protein
MTCVCVDVVGGKKDAGTSNGTVGEMTPATQVVGTASGDVGCHSPPEVREERRDDMVVTPEAVGDLRARTGGEIW